jgi:predicted TIM-barrel fold metal-dependent hydrolase
MYNGPLIDCDVHHTRARDSELLDYLPLPWREFVTAPSERLVRLGPPTLGVFPPNMNTKRLDSYPEDGGLPGSSYELLAQQLLDVHHPEVVVLTFGIGAEMGQPSPAFALALAEALNDWSLDRWIDGTGDHRLRTVVLAPTHVPEQGAAEIRRVGEHPSVVGALLPHNALGQPYGHRVFWPLYRAAVEMDLPIFFHAGTGELFGSQSFHQAGAWTHNSRSEYYASIYQAQVLHLTSMVVQGVFEEFPTLRIVLAEHGLSWLPWAVASMESNIEQLRYEGRRMRRRPSEYLREHVFLTTQPCEATPEDSSEFVELMSTVEGIDEMLCFSSDYPHFDSDDPKYIARILPAAWHENVFHRNARRALRLARPAAAGHSDNLVSPFAHG